MSNEDSKEVKKSQKSKVNLVSLFEKKLTFKENASSDAPQNQVKPPVKKSKGSRRERQQQSSSIETIGHGSLVQFEEMSQDKDQ